MRLLQTLIIAILAVSTTATVEAKPATAMRCSGYYVLPSRDGGFSVKVESNAVEFVYIDYSPSELMRYATNSDGSLTFSIDHGSPSHMRCDATGATLQIAASDTYMHNPEEVIHIPARRVRLVRSTGDIWKYAAKQGWPVDD